MAACPTGKDDPNNLGAGSYAFMQLMGVVAIGWMWLRLAKARAAPTREDPFCAAKLVTARHYALHALPRGGRAAAQGRGRRREPDGAAGGGLPADAKPRSGRSKPDRGDDERRV